MEKKRSLGTLLDNVNQEILLNIDLEPNSTKNLYRINISDSSGWQNAKENKVLYSPIISDVVRNVMSKIHPNRSSKRMSTKGKTETNNSFISFAHEDSKREGSIINNK